MLKILFFELQKTRFDRHPFPHGFRLLKQNQYTKKKRAKAYWDVQVYAENT